MFDIITFGSATNDIFLKTDKDFKFGQKVLVNDLEIFTGGGGVNTASTFKKQGLKTAYVGLVGLDEAGLRIKQELGKSAKFLKRTGQTAQSFIISPHGKERTILIYRGACHFMKDVPFKKIKRTKWFYIAPLHLETLKLLKPLVIFAKENNIKIALNPSQEQLKEKSFLEIIKEIDFLLLNRTEADLLPKDFIEKCSGIIAITNARKPSFILKGNDCFKVFANNISFVEKTGAGDAFGAGFVAGLLKKNDIEYAIRLATSNAEACIKEVGAQNGLLNQKDKLSKVKIQKI